MKKFGILFIFFAYFSLSYAQQVLTIKDCRNLALENNKQLSISNENIKKAEWDKKNAFSQYFPNIAFTGGYIYNHKNIALLGENKYLPIGTVMPDGSFGFTPDQINNQWTSINGNPVPLDMTGNPFDPSLNPEKILWKEHAIIPKKQFELDIQSIFVGSISLTQPIFMGGKIVAYNKIADYAKELANNMKTTNIQETILQVDQTYWQIISLINKQKLSDNYVGLLKQMNEDVEALIEEGVATHADGLSIKVKLNEAEMTKLQVDNGVQLSKMLLCQLCGLPIDSSIKLFDETIESVPVNQSTASGNAEDALINRPEIKSLSIARKIFEKKEDLIRAEMFPSVALTGNYLISNPNFFNGIQSKFAGTWNVGVMVNIPLFHFGEKNSRLKSAKVETRIKQLEMDEAKEKIELQVNQSKFKIQEARKKLIAADKNKESAEENLAYANLGFKEGVIPSSNVMEAQTAWFKAHSELIDAQISLRLGQVELEKALGILDNKIEN
ncbi:MAG: TolC family protein [Dysgonamonadaceae bacterium]|jgi:outer membrane protein TolC|nr:TolC family protein [Dysgonamonadaceae bacterium]